MRQIAPLGPPSSRSQRSSDVSMPFAGLSSETLGEEKLDELSALFLDAFSACSDADPETNRGREEELQYFRVCRQIWEIARGARPFDNGEWFDVMQWAARACVLRQPAAQGLPGPSSATA